MESAGIAAVYAGRNSDQNGTDAKSVARQSESVRAFATTTGSTA